MSEQGAKTRVLITGSAGFIGGYLVEDLLHRGYEVVGIDNYSKYGRVSKSYDDHPDYTFFEGDAQDVDLLIKALDGCTYFIAGAALIGGVSYTNAYPYDILATNERITASSCDAAIRAFHENKLERVIYMSSSMVFESATSFPSREDEVLEIPPAKPYYGFQKLAVEYFARAAYDQYEVPYTIIRPFNVVGIGEHRALEPPTLLPGNVKLATSHVVPDLVKKVLQGADPLPILGDGSQVRHYTYGADLARGIIMAMESPDAVNNDFNIATPESTTVLELAERIWTKIKGPDVPFRYVSEEPYAFDVLNRVPSVEKAKEVLGFEAETTLDEMLDEVIPWLERAIADGTL